VMHYEIKSWFNRQKSNWEWTPFLIQYKAIK
jgi:hypothetical protein